jgi:CBS domain-containing protein
MAHGTFSHETTGRGERALGWQREQGVGDGEGVTAAATCGVWGLASGPGGARVESRVPGQSVKVKKKSGRQGEGRQECGERYGEREGGEPLVADVMGRVAPVAPSHLPVWAARKIAQLKKAQAIFVEAEGRLFGVVEARVLDRAPDGDPLSAHMRPIFFSVQPTTSVARVRELLIRQRVSCLPVAAGMFLVGTISRADVERALAKVPPRAPRAPKTALARAAA